MINKLVRKRIGLALFFFGGVLIFFAAAFNFLQIDPDNVSGLQGWGKRRFLILLIGLFLIPFGKYVSSERVMDWMLPIRVFLDIVPGRRYAYKFGRKVLAIWITALLPALLLYLHTSGIFVFQWTQIKLEKIDFFEGYASSYRINYPRDMVFIGAPPFYVFENNNQLPLKLSLDNSGKYDVVKYGMGRYYIDENFKMFFSSLDNSDPLKNNRTYTMLQPQQIGDIPRFLGLLLFGVVTFIIVARHRHIMIELVKAPPFIIPSIIFLFGFLINRLWVVTDFPILEIHPDSLTYFALVEEIGERLLINFGIRPIMYPLFMKTVFMLSNTNFALLVAQNVVSFLSGLILIYSIYVWRKWISYLAVFFVYGYLSGITSLEYDTSMLSESLYTSLLILSFSFLIIGLFPGRKSGYLAASSVAMACVILTRPSGIFLIVTYVLVLLYIVSTKYGIESILSYSIPFPVILTLVCLYNYFAIGAFSLTTWGEANLAVATFTYWEEDSSYPNEINQKISEIKSIIDKRFEIADKDKKKIDTSWDHEYLSGYFVEGFNGEALNVAMQMGAKEIYGAENRNWVRTVSIDSVKKHPFFYIKFVMTMLINYYTLPAETDFRQYIYNRANLIYIDEHYSGKRDTPIIMTHIGKEYSNTAPPDTIIIINRSPETRLTDRMILKETAGWKLYYVMQQLRQKYFSPIPWVVLFFATFFFASGKLIYKRGHDLGAFMIFIIGVSNIGAGLLVSLVEYSQPRYSYPMEWAYYTVVMLAPLLFHTKSMD